MERMTTRTVTYKTNVPGFYVDIASSGKLYEAWLYHESYGIKSLLFGCYKKDFTKESFLDMVESALDYQDYVVGYMEEYMD